MDEEKCEYCACRNCEDSTCRAAICSVCYNEEDGVDYCDHRIVARDEDDDLWEN